MPDALTKPYITEGQKIPKLWDEHGEYVYMGSCLGWLGPEDDLKQALTKLVSEYDSLKAVHLELIDKTRTGETT